VSTGPDIGSLPYIVTAGARFCHCYMTILVQMLSAALYAPINNWFSIGVCFIISKHIDTCTD
jgi:hypothetical protein